MNNNPPNPAPAEMPVVSIPRPRCPICRSVDLKIYRTTSHGRQDGDRREVKRDGPVERYCRCNACLAKFRVILM